MSTINQPFLRPVDEPPSDGPPPATPWGKVLWAILSLAPAIFVGRLGWVGMKVTDTALLGHVGTHALEASSLSDLWTTASGVFIQGRVLGIFVGNAVGAAKAGTAPWSAAGEWLQVSLAVLGVIAVFVMALWACTEPILRLLGKDELVSDASFFSLVLMSCIPARVIFSQLTQYLSAQGIVKPAMFIALIGLGSNLVLGFVFVIGVPAEHFVPYAEPASGEADGSVPPGYSGVVNHTSAVGGYGFPACPIVTSAVEWTQLLALVGICCVCLGYHKKGWPSGVGCCGFSLRFVTRVRVVEYLRLYVPAALSIASDFWRMSAVGAFAAQLSDLDLAVFTASYRIMWISLVLSSSLTGGVGISVGQALGGSRPNDAKRAIAVGILLAIIANTLIGAAILAFPRQLGAIFSNDVLVLDSFEEVRVTLMLTVVSMNAAVVFEGLLMTTGRTKTVLLVGVIGSWCGQVPIVALLVIYWQRSLRAVYIGVSSGYFILCILLGITLLRLDWEALAAEAHRRANMGNSSAQAASTSPSEAAERQDGGTDDAPKPAAE